MITIYTTPTCAFCKMVKTFFGSKGIEYQEVDVSADQALQEKLHKETGAVSVPITRSGDTYVVGWNPKKLMELT